MLVDDREHRLDVPSVQQLKFNYLWKVLFLVFVTGEQPVVLVSVLSDFIVIYRVKNKLAPLDGAVNKDVLSLFKELVETANHVAGNLDFILIREFCAVVEVLVEITIVLRP